MTDNLYNQNFKDFKKTEFFINDIHEQLNAELRKDKKSQLLDKIEDISRCLFSPTYTLLESIYLNIKHGEPFIIPQRVKSIAKQKIEISIGTISWLLILTMLFVDWRIALSFILFQMISLLSLPFLTDFYNNLVQKKFKKGISSLFEKEGVKNIEKYDLISHNNFITLSFNRKLTMQQFSLEDDTDLVKFNTENKPFFIKRKLKCKYFSVINNEIILLLDLKEIKQEQKSQLIENIDNMLDNALNTFSSITLSQKLDEGLEDILRKHELI